MVIVVEVPVIWEIALRGRLVVLSVGAALLFGFIGFGLFFKNLGNGPLIGFRGDEDCWHLQWG